MTGSGGRDRSENAPPPISKWEWAIAAVGFALVVGVIGHSAYHALATRAVVPEVTIEHVGTHATRGGHVVHFRAHNHGSATAADLQITGELRQGSSIVETSGATLGYLPSFSRRKGGLFFQEDPDRYELRLYPKGYADP